MKLLLYCTKAKKQKDLLWSNNLKHFFLDGAYNRLIDDLPEYLLNGKIVAECDFEVEEIDTVALSEHVYDDYYNNTFDIISKESCMTCEQMIEYLGATWDSTGYAIHIKNLHIFDSPIFLEGFDDNKGHTLRKAPKNMCKVLKVNIGEYDYKDLNSNAYEPCILISVKPQEMCRIANKEQTTLVRRNVSKEMLCHE